MTIVVLSLCGLVFTCEDIAGMQARSGGMVRSLAAGILTRGRGAPRVSISDT